MIVLATHNPHKITELQYGLARAGIVSTEQRIYFSDSVEEDGLSFVENALKKARFASKKTGLPALADDSGLEVNSLGGAPGIFSARYSSCSNDNAEEGEQDNCNITKLLAALSDRPKVVQRMARYSCAMVYVQHEKDPMPLIGIGHWYGDILRQRRTRQGIGYDDVMWIPALVKTVSELSLEQKMRYGHRAQALRAIIHQLTQCGDG